ncbi:MAG: 2-C-methyl-D-erythritol 2,4-cyclodiphosphate synthase [Isosphaeraceae bacterium]
MRANLARLLRLLEPSVNVKAKTGEHVGPVGRGEAISCQAVVLIRQSEVS